MAGIWDTIKSSIAASNQELERNTGNTGAYVAPADKSKEQILAENGIGIAGPSQNSTIGVAGQQFTPQPGKMGPLASVPTPSSPAAAQNIRSTPNAAPLSSPASPSSPAPALAQGPAQSIASPNQAGRPSFFISGGAGYDPADRRIAAASPKENVDSMGRGYNEQVANAMQVNANNGIAPTVSQIKTTGMTTDQQMSMLNAGNRDGRFDKQIATLVTQAANEKSMAVENAKAQAGIAGHQIAAAGQIAAAQANAAGRVDAAKASKVGDAAKDETKNLHDILTNGYGVTPTKAAISAYKGHEVALDGWNKSISKYLGAYQKADPANYPHVEKALLNFHRNPKDPDALKAVQQAGKLVQGGSDKMPDWFTQALQMPQFKTAGLQPWKNQMPIAGA